MGDGNYMILFSDLHLEESSADVVFNEVLPEIVQACEIHKTNKIGFLGDFWDTRYCIPVTLQNRLYYWLVEAVGGHRLDLRILPGNHDQVNVAGENALEVFQGLPYVRVYTDPGYDTDGLWIPYRKSVADVEQIIAMFSKYKSANTPIFTHLGICGAYMNDVFQDNNGVPIGLFDGWGRVLCGHYHKRQSVGKRLNYIGSPYQVTAGERGQDKGYAVWDGNKLEYITTQWGRKFHYFTVSVPGQAIDLSGVRPGDEVRVQAAVGVDPTAVGQQLIAAGIVNHAVTPDVADPQTRLTVEANASLPQFAKAYLNEKVSDPAEAGHLWEMFNGILEQIPKCQR